MDTVEYFEKVKEYQYCDIELMVCANCRWWEVSEKQFEEYRCLAEGWCHRYPPSVPLTSHINDTGIPSLVEPRFETMSMGYPVTFAEEWCGEFKWAANPRWTE